jgi:membrane protease YdiL (CAAX protease family)
VRVRGLFYSGERLRAIWRLLLFVALTVAGLWVLGTAASLITLRLQRVGELWELAIPSIVIVLSLLFASAVVMRWVERRPVAAVGLPLGREAWKGFGKGALIGGGFIALIVVLQTLVGWLKPTPGPGSLSGWAEYLGGLALLLAVAAAGEELLFRGYPFQVLVEAMGAPLAVILSAVAFGAIHAFNPEVGFTAVVNIALAGVIMAAAYLRTRSLWVAIGLHWAWNWVMAGLFDLPVSGIEFEVPGYDTLMLGPEAMTGGAFGPEAGLLTTLLSVPLIIWLFRTPWLSESQRMVELRPLIDSRVPATRD